MTDVVIIPAGSSTITICHFTQGGTWNAITINHSALNGHQNHDSDIWPPVESVTAGMNWPLGQAIYLNGCVLAASPSPTASESATVSPTPSVSESLPPTGPAEILGQVILGMALILTGGWLKWRSTW